jgi:excisionase family DNA binding protein
MPVRPGLVRDPSTIAGLARKLLSRDEAAAYLGIGLTTFETTVQPELPIVRIGRRVLFDVEDLDRWVAAQKVGSSFPPTETARPSTTSVSASPSRARRMGVASNAQLERRSRSELLAKLRGSTPMKSTVGRRGTAA